MRWFIFTCISGCLYGQSLFVPFDNLSSFPETVYDSLSAYNTILLGETHGTQEAPKIAESLAEIFLRHNRSVILALEISEQDQKHIDLFMKTGDTLLFSTMNLFRHIKDGRSSIAMKNLIAASYGKKNLSLLCFDIADNFSAKTADSLMARNILYARSLDKNAVLICLSGNIHSNTTKGFRKGYETMGYYLKDSLHTQLLSLNIRFLGGYAYNYTDSEGRGIHPLTEDTSQFKAYLKKEGYIFMDEGFKEFGYNGIIYLRKATASIPYLKN